MIDKRISKNSCYEIKFTGSLPINNQALRKSGYKTELTFNPNPSYTKSSCTENATLFGSTLLNNQILTHIGKAFFHLLRKHFPPNHGLYKICNKNNFKLS